MPDQAASVPVIHHHYVGNPAHGCPGAGSTCDQPCPEWGVIQCSGACLPPNPTPEQFAAFVEALNAPYSPVDGDR